MSNRTTLPKRDANTLASDANDSNQGGTLKRARKDPAPQEDEFDISDQELDEEALIAATEEAESAVSNPPSSQPGVVLSQPRSTDASVPEPATATTALDSNAVSTSSSAPGSSLRQATLTPSKNPSKLSSASLAASTTPSDPVPRLQPPSDPASDPLWLERQSMSPTWFSILRPELDKSYFKTLKAFLAAEDKAGKKTYPPRELIYSWSRLVPSPQQVRVVVVGQDPYHGPNQACGLSFSVPKGVPTPPSLRNIYKELTTEYPGSFRSPNHGCLDGWAKQGVLMLNACLTVSAGAAGSHHGKGWEGLTKHVLKRIADEAAGSGAAKAANANATANSKLATMFAKVQNKSSAQPEKGDSQSEAKRDSNKDAETGEGQNKGVVFLIWGAPAAKTLAEAGVNDKNPNILILKSPHPSPLSAHRGFLGNGHFKKANEWLEQRYGKSGMIDWTKL